MSLANPRLSTVGAAVHARSRVMQWASTRHVVGTDIPLPVGPSLITSATQIAAALVTTVAMLGALAWMALLATGLVHLTPNPGWFGDFTATVHAMHRVNVIAGYVILFDLVCVSIFAAVHVHAAVTRSAATPDFSTCGPSEIGKAQA